MHPDAPYPVQYSVDYPDRPLNRLTTFFRLFMVIPIAIVLALIEGGGYAYGGGRAAGAVGAAGLVVLPTLLLILFRQKYPRWWFNWNLELMRLSARVGRLPGTDGGPLSLDRRASGGASRVSLSGRAQRP
jgi:hypothetical protein